MLADDFRRLPSVTKEMNQRPVNTVNKISWTDGSKVTDSWSNYIFKMATTVAKKY